MAFFWKFQRKMKNHHSIVSRNYSCSFRSGYTKFSMADFVNAYIIKKVIEFYFRYIVQSLRILYKNQNPSFLIYDRLVTKLNNYEMNTF